MRLSRPFIRLPFRFDATRLAQEAAQFPPAQWMAHPSGLPGNSAIALIASGGGDNDAFVGEKLETPWLRRCPYARQVMAAFGEVLSRSRFMRLEAGAEVRWHVDFNYHWFSRVRIHIPVVTTEAVVFHCGDARIHMAAGECWIFDSWRRHRVVNGSDRARVHLVVDTSGSARFWELVGKVEGKAEGKTEGSVADADGNSRDAVAERYIPYDANATPRLLLERFSNAPVLPPGECDALVEDLIADFTANPANDQRLAAAYVRLLRGFVRDWRALWLLHGEEPAGRPRYRALINETKARLHPNPRALTTSSNAIGVNAVFTGRVLSAALAGTAGAASAR